MNEDKKEVFDNLKKDYECIHELNGGDEIIENNKVKRLKLKKYSWQFYLVFVFFLLVILIVFMVLKAFPKLTLIGKEEEILNYKEKYVEKGYKLIVNGNDYTDKVVVVGEVNSEKIGTYTITYSYQNGIFKTTRKRVVKVDDRTAPYIIFSGNRTSYICPNSDYKEDKYRVVDNYDGNLTSKVSVKSKENGLIYTVSDKAGNTMEFYKKIIKKDVFKPYINLMGDKVVNLRVGEVYQEPGYIALDNCDGDITNNVVIDGEVDINRVGSYLIHYKVSDGVGNTFEVVRTVNVNNPLKAGVIYLTFDDGPFEGTTNKILDILKEEGVKATFFVTNGGPDYLIKREYDEGHTVALHTSSHDYANVYASVSSYFRDLNSVQSRVESIIGYKSMIIRFPGGSSNTVSRKYKLKIMSVLARKVQDKGYKYYDWNISSGDAGEVKTSEGVYHNVITRLSHSRANVVLMHDIKSYTRDALRNIIRYGKENGYVFEKIDENTEMITQRINN